MVYSSVPVQIDCSGEGIPVNDDDSLSLWSSESSEGERHVMLNDRNAIDESWNPFQHDKGGSDTKPMKSQDLFKVPKPTTALPPLEDLKYPQDAGVIEDVLVYQSSCISSITRLTSCVIGVNMRARAEMLQHQLGKPLRKLSAGKRILSRTGALEWLKWKSGTSDDNSIRCSKDDTEDVGSSNNQSAPAGNKITSRDYSRKVSKDLANENKNDTKSIEGLRKGSEGRLAALRTQGLGLPPGNIWPLEENRSGNPSANNHRIAQGLEAHFHGYPVPQDDFTTPRVRRSIEPRPTIDSEGNDDDDDEGNDNIFVLHDDLD